jgi:hypothetical protein
VAGDRSQAVVDLAGHQHTISLREQARSAVVVSSLRPLAQTASVVDPFGNVLGIMYNRHYLDILGKRGGAQ